GQIDQRRYWSPAPRPPRPVDPNELGDALRDAVARHLIADVPVGLFLSAGVDSVAIARLASDVANDVRAYTVAFDTGDDEAADAAALADRLGVKHEIVPLAGSEVLGWMDEILASMDQPTVDGVNSWVISKAVREAGLVVALSGLGGDD